MPSRPPRGRPGRRRRCPSSCGSVQVRRATSTPSESPSSSVSGSVERIGAVVSFTSAASVEPVVVGVGDRGGRCRGIVAPRRRRRGRRSSVSSSRGSVPWSSISSPSSEAGRRRSRGRGGRCRRSKTSSPSSRPSSSVSGSRGSVPWVLSSSPSSQPSSSSVGVERVGEVGVDFFAVEGTVVVGGVIERIGAEAEFTSSPSLTPAVVGVGVVGIGEGRRCTSTPSDEAVVVGVRDRSGSVRVDQHLLAVVESVVVGVRVEGIGEVGVDLVAVGEAIVVGVGVERVGALVVDLFAVEEAVVVGVVVERVRALLEDLFAVAQPVVIGVRIVGIGADLVLGGGVQAIAIRIGVADDLAPAVAVADVGVAVGDVLGELVGRRRGADHEAQLGRVRRAGVRRQVGPRHVPVDEIIHRSRRAAADVGAGRIVGRVGRGDPVQRELRAARIGLRQGRVVGEERGLRSVRVEGIAACAVLGEVDLVRVAVDEQQVVVLDVRGVPIGLDHHAPAEAAPAGRRAARARERLVGEAEAEVDVGAVVVHVRGWSRGIPDDVPPRAAGDVATDIGELVTGLVDQRLPVRVEGASWPSQGHSHRGHPSEGRNESTAFSAPHIQIGVEHRCRLHSPPQPLSSPGHTLARSGAVQQSDVKRVKIFSPMQGAAVPDAREDVGDRQLGPRPTPKRRGQP